MVRLLQSVIASTLVAICAVVCAPCSSFHARDIVVPGAEVVSISGIQATNITVATDPPIYDLNFCNVSVILTHPGVKDSVLVEVWLPTENWNGRFQATGGGGYTSGLGDTALAPAVTAGYVASQTDGGNIGTIFELNPRALTPDGQVNWSLLTDYGYRSLHDMTVVAKAVIKTYYGKAPSYSYWNGCSAGGRQGLVQAQMYPDDYDGILAAAPAVDVPSLVMAIQWPYTVMQQEKYSPSQCEFTAFINASITQCDGLDGVKDSIISNLQDCLFDPYSLVGKNISCEGRKVTITNVSAGIYQKILEGPTVPYGDNIWYEQNMGTGFNGLYTGTVTTNATPGIYGKILDGTTAPYGDKLWYGQNIGTGFNGLYPGNVDVVTANGTTVSYPSSISRSYIQYLLKKDPLYDTSKITYSDFAELFAQSNDEYNWIIGSNNPDLSAFRNGGGKMITWHGLADNIIFPDGTLNYYHQVEDVMGGTSAVSDFYRLYLVPGVNHCGGGYGPLPTDPLGALVAWVEHGTAPDILKGQYTDVDGAIVNHNICRYPLVSRYDGKGDPKSADSYTCATSFGT